jgi:hypothetical protein
MPQSAVFGITTTTRKDRKTMKEPISSRAQIRTGSLLCIPWGGRKDVTEAVVMVSHIEESTFKFILLESGEIYHTGYPLDLDCLKRDIGTVFVVDAEYAQEYLRVCIERYEDEVRGLAIQVRTLGRAVNGMKERFEDLSRA